MNFTVILPGYFPAIPVFGRALAADVIVWADSFVFNKHSDINRTVIKTIAGPKWLTVPVFSAHGGGSPISAMHIDNHEKWQERHKHTLEINYKNAAYYHYYSAGLETFFNREWTNLPELLWSSLSFLAQELPIKATIVKSSTLPHLPDRSDRVITWGRELGCDMYLYADEEKSFIDRDKIKLSGIQLNSYTLAPFSYFQQYSDILFPLSVLDLLLNEGRTASSLIIRNSHTKTE